MIAKAGRWGRAGVGGRGCSPRPARPGAPRVYGRDRVPAPGEPATGGTAKLQKLAERWPSHPADFTLLYLASPHFPRDLGPLLRIARRRRPPSSSTRTASLPGLGGRPRRGAEPAAAPRARGRRPRPLPERLLQALRGRVPRRAAGEWEILHNAVDVDGSRPGRAVRRAARAPARRRPDAGYRIELAVATLRAVRASHPGARLLVTGRLVDRGSRWLEQGVELVGRYSQREAPDVFRRAHLLLHPKVNDPCPTRRARGDGVRACRSSTRPAAARSSSSGEGGIGVPHRRFVRARLAAEPEALAEAVLAVLADRAALRRGRATARAVERFALEPWLDRHAALFAKLTSS